MSKNRISDLVSKGPSGKHEHTMGLGTSQTGLVVVWGDMAYVTGNVLDPIDKQIIRLWKKGDISVGSLASQFGVSVGAVLDVIRRLDCE